MTMAPTPIPLDGRESLPIVEKRWRERLCENESVKLAALVVVFTLPALAFLRNFYMTDPDFGWHLRAGDWILSQRAVPYTDPFSAYGADKPWYDYSWLFDIFFALLYRYFGLSGFAILEVAFRVAIPACLFRLQRSLGLTFWPAALSAGMAAYSIYQIYAPRPGMFTVIFLILELQILFGALLKGKFSGLYWLIPLFWLWASIHIQFIHGLIIFGMFAGERLLYRALRREPAPQPLPLKSLAVFGACVLGTMLTPYGWHIYSTVFVYAGQKQIYEAISEMLAMNFRHPSHFVLVLLAFCAAGALGWSRKLRPLWLLLFAFSAVLGFRSIKDTWILAIVSAALFGIGLSQESGDETTMPARHKWALALCTAAVLAVAWQRYGVNNDWIEMGLAGSYPEAAVRYVKQHHLSGPLYNDFTSGGFLIWRLPNIPVSMDGRTNVHGDERVRAYTNALKGMPGWENDEDLAKANLIIWTAKSPLPALLGCDARFKQVYKDPQAVVFVRK